MKWQCYVNSNFGYQLVEDNFPDRFNRNDVTKAFKGRFNLEVAHVNPSPRG